ncbi:protein TALPID3 isoform X2 [Antennarius striatus]|uniref:protein TALPID3 isoform X2 n=1 Tax=Antennarius striatus TaxID=241820 RepID=UPI0035B0DB31
MSHHPDEQHLNHSSTSSDTGDVLIRSTRAHFSDRKQEVVPGSGSVRITIQKLRDAPAQTPVSDQRPVRPGTEEQQRAKPRQKPDLTPPLRAGADRRSPDGRTLKIKDLTKENREPPAADFSPDRKSSAGTLRQQHPDDDLLTSRFTSGGRGAVLAALKKRATQRREVKVQLMDQDPHQTSSHNAPGLRISSQDAPGLRISSQNASGLRTSSQDSPGPRTSSQDAHGLRTSSQDAPGLITGLQDSVGVMGVQTEGGRPTSCQRDDTNMAALIQTQVDARVSQLADGVHKLLQTDRDQVWSLSRQTLRHVETHSHQLQLQSKLLESTLGIVMSRVPGNPTASGSAYQPDRRTSADPTCLKVTHLDTAAKALLKQQPTTSETRPVTMATPHRDRQPEENRNDRYDRDAPGVSTATRPAEVSRPRSSANGDHMATSRANEMLEEMERVRAEMKALLRETEESLKATKSGPDQHQSQQKPHQSQQPHPHQKQSQPHPSQQNPPLQPKSQQTESEHVQFQQDRPEPQQVRSQQTQQIHPQQTRDPPHKSRSTRVQKRPVVPSVLEEAGRVLRQVQRKKKILEENLETLLRSNAGEVLHCQLEALAANRDWTDEVRIKRTVDAWISTLAKDVQAELSSENAVTQPSPSKDAPVTSQQRVEGRAAPTGQQKPVSALRRTGSKTGRGSKVQSAPPRPQGAELDKPTSRLADGGLAESDGEAYLSRLYGRAPYEGVRRTQKTSPYLRFSSPGSPLGKKPRPQLVERVIGVKMKSCKTQTSLAPPLSRPPDPPQLHYVISSSHLTNCDPAGVPATLADSYPVPMAIPLCHPRTVPSSRHLVTSPLKAPPTSSVVAMDNGASELQSHVNQLDAGEGPPPSSPPPLPSPPPPLPSPPPPPPLAGPQVDIKEVRNEEEEDDDNIFPGTDFLVVADVNQEEVSAVNEEVLEIEGGPCPPPAVYEGPAFPPQAPSALPAPVRTSTPDVDLQGDALVDRLVEWVEQQLMARMIPQMYQRPTSDPAQNQAADQSESEQQSLTSDIVEAAGGGGLQLFVDANVEVDSALIRRLVDEVITEQVALMLGDTRDTGPGPGPGQEPPGPAANQEEVLVPTPVPTPPPSPAPSRGETPPLATPPPSEMSSVLTEVPLQPITAPEHVDTPTASPEPAHSAGNSPSVQQAPPSVTWGGSVLPLEEEKPEEHLDTPTQPPFMPIAEEPPVPPPPPPAPPAPTQSDLAPEARPSSPPSSSEESSTSSTSNSSSPSPSSSSAVTAGTEAALKHISEGELLIGSTQLAGPTEEEIIYSLSSTGQELQEVDFDPLSEEQQRGHEVLHSLVTKLESWENEQARGERPQPEGSRGRGQSEEEEEEEVSQGEVRDDWTTNPNKSVAAAWQEDSSSSSSEQMSPCADESESSLENQDSVATGDQMVEPISALTSDLWTDRPLSAAPPPHAARQGVPLLVRQKEKHTDGLRWMDVHLSSIKPVEEVKEEVKEEVMEEVKEESMLDSPVDTDSSISDVFDGEEKL